MRISTYTLINNIFTGRDAEQVTKRPPTTDTPAIKISSSSQIKRLVNNPPFDNPNIIKLLILLIFSFDCGNKTNQLNKLFLHRYNKFVLNLPKVLG